MKYSRHLKTEFILLPCEAWPGPYPHSTQEEKGSLHWVLRMICSCLCLSTFHILYMCIFRSLCICSTTSYQNLEATELTYYFKVSFRLFLNRSRFLVVNNRNGFQFCLLVFASPPPRLYWGIIYKHISSIQHDVLINVYLVKWFQQLLFNMSITSQVTFCVCVVRMLKVFLWFHTTGLDFKSGSTIFRTIRVAHSA